MLPSMRFIFPALLGFVLLCTASKILPRAPYAAFEPPRFIELHDVMIARQGDLDLPSALLPRMKHLADPPQERISTNLSSTISKRTLLGIRQSCDPGYGLCDVTGNCCPNSGDSGACCDDGTCVTDAETCCTNGGACGSGEDCCLQGCKPTANSCCTDDWNCPPGTFCCGDQNCAVLGGECCEGGTSCDTGLHCVVLNGVQGCCADYDCTSFGSGAPAPVPAPAAASASASAAPSISITPFSFTPISVTPISFTPITNPPIPTITFPSITIPSITVPTILAIDYVWYTTTFTWFYYSYYITFVAPSSHPTSQRTSTTQIVSVYASNTVDATSQFASLSSAVTFPTEVTAPGFTNSLPSPTNLIGGGPTAAAGGAVSGSVKGVEMGRSGLGVAVALGCLSVFTCFLMVWL